MKNFLNRKGWSFLNIYKFEEILKHAKVVGVFGKTCSGKTSSSVFYVFRWVNFVNSQHAGENISLIAGKLDMFHKIYIHVNSVVRSVPLIDDTVLNLDKVDNIVLDLDWSLIQSEENSIENVVKKLNKLDKQIMFSHAMHAKDCKDSIFDVIANVSINKHQDIEFNILKRNTSLITSL